MLAPAVGKEAAPITQQQTRCVRILAQRRSLDAARQRYAHEEAAVRTRPRRQITQLRVERRQQCVQTGRVERLETLQLGIQPPPPEKLMDHRLGDVAGVDVGILRHLRQGARQRLRRDSIADTQAGADQLAERGKPEDARRI